MNLKRIRDLVLMASDHVPDSSSYFYWVNTLIDQYHRELWDSRCWTFNVKTVNIPVFPDKTPSDWDNPMFTIANGDTTLSSSINMFQAWDAGQVLELGGLEYTISSVLSQATISIDPPYKGATTSELNEFTLKHRIIFLPKDCVEVLDVSYRDAPVPTSTRWGSLSQLQSKTEQMIGLGLQDTGTPTSYVSLPDYYIRTPEDRLTPTLTLSTSSTNGYLAAGTYTFTYSYVLGAVDVDQYGLLPESDPWPGTVSITVPAPSTNTITFAVFLPQSRYNSADRPLNIKPYSVTTLFDGRTELQEMRAADELGPLIAGSSSINIGSDMFTPSPQPIRHPYHGGRSRAIRLWPRPNSTDINIPDPLDDDPIDRFAQSWVQLTYIIRPEHILNDGDIPNMPVEFHQLLVDRVLVEVYTRKGNLTAAAQFQRKYNERLPLLLARYGDQKDSVVIRSRSWGMYDPNNYINQYPMMPGNKAIWRG